MANEFENIAATKEASGNFSQIMEIIAKRPKNFAVFSGDDATTLPLISVGADGLVSVCSNEIPKETSEMVEKALDGAWTSAQKNSLQNSAVDGSEFYRSLARAV
ncbi:MAG: dihydrodipicolinate synthase family protein [Pyrinomonadaceae bacterium]